MGQTTILLNHEWISYVGILAAVLTTGAYIPQAYKTIKTRSTRDLSMVTFSLLFIGVVMWLVYGILIHDFPLILANVITAGLTGIIFYMKLTEKK